MNRNVFPAAVLAIALAATATPVHAAVDYFGKTVDAPGDFAFPKDRVAGRALVKFSTTSPDAAGVSNVLKQIETDTGIALQLVRTSVLGWGLYDVVDLSDAKVRPNETATMSLIEVLRDHDAVKDITDERWYRAFATPNDPGYDDMWHLNSIGAAAAWDVTTGLSSQRIGVVDTGTLREHEDLNAKDVAGFDFIANTQQANDGNGRDSNYNDAGDGADCGNGFQDDSWHGSHVAGTILATTNNNEGITGINWAAGLVTARALGKCGGSLADIMEGAAWLVGGNVTGVTALAAADRVSVMNLSLGGGGGCSGFEQDVIDFVNQQGAIFVAAAGNDGGPVGSPGVCTGVVTVAAHGPGNARPLTNYSNFGNSVEIVAPGGEIQSNQNQGVLSAVGPNDGYGWYQGTSMASPHVAGAISLMQAIDPALTRTDVNTLLQTYGVDCTGCQGKKALKIDLLLQEMDPGTPGPGPGPAPVDDAYEPNDTWDTAPSIVCGAGLSLVMATNNIDWFKLDTTGLASFTATVEAGAQDLDLYVTDGPTNQDVIGSSTTETGSETVTLTGGIGIVGLAVIPWETAAGAYSLGVTCVDETPPDETPPDETPPDETPPDETPPDETPPDETPPDETPPDETPPDETPPDDKPGENPDGTPGDGTVPDDETPSVGDDANANLDDGVSGGTVEVSGGCSQTARGDVALFSMIAFVGLVARRRVRAPH